jgi:pyrophosphatase PpaX
MIKAVLFDLDGTLINTNRLIIKSYQHTYKTHLGIDVEAKEIVRYFGEPLKTVLARYDKENAHELFKTYNEYNERLHDELSEGYHGVTETVEKLKKAGLKVGIVTSKRRIMAERGLKLFGLYALMDCIVTMDDTTEHKPSAAPALEACRLLGTDPSEALMVGDSHYDIQCGQNAGCSTCLVKYTALSVEEIMEYKPDYAIDTFPELLDVIKKANAT